MQITYKGEPVHTIGTLPTIGTLAPNFSLVKTDFSNLTLKEFAGKTVILNIFISIDTPVCAGSVKKFNQIISNLENAVVLCISEDLPFAQKRFCAGEGLVNVIPASTFRNPEFGKSYGVTLIDSPLSHLLSRAIVVIDPKQTVIYTEQVSELTSEPNYTTVLKAIR